MTKLLVCVDGSLYADNITTHAAWAAEKLNCDIDLLHVLRRHSDYQAPHDDHTGAIGLGARSGLMQELTKVDEERAKLDQQKGRLILEHSEKALKKAGIDNVNAIYRRGSLAQTITEFEDDADIIFIGKRGEQANPDSEFLGSNLEKVARTVHKPLFLVSRYMRPMKKFLIAYDGKEHAEKAVDFACSSALLKGMDCNLLMVGQDSEANMSRAAEKLKAADYTVKMHHEKTGSVDEVISRYVDDNGIDLLLTGAYSHSHIRTMLLGSTTAKLIKACHIPIMLFR